MSLKGRGYQDCILRVDLTNGQLRQETWNEKAARLLLGGRGLGTWLLYNEMSAGADPLGPDNLLVLVTGPLTGTMAPTAGRIGVVTRSPATGAILDSYAGGYFGETLKYAGFDAVAIRGKAKVPQVLVIDNSDVKLEPAGDLWGADVMSTREKLLQIYGKDVVTAVVGPAGERCSPISGIFCDTRCMARGGGGAVMGAKGLKAVVIKGSGKIRVHNPSEFEEAIWVANRMLRMSTQIKRMQLDGTLNILELVNVAGALPTRNFQEGQFENSRELWSDKWQPNWKVTAACHGCPIGCTKISYSAKRDIWVDGPEYETTFALGSNTGVADRDAILYANYLCDKYGVDTISAGVIVGFVMEMFERGLIGKDELEGVEARFGDGQALVDLIDKIGSGKGIGALLEKGVRTISREYPGSEDFAMEVKGLEMPGYLPRAAKAVALSYAVAERGACHLHGSPIVEVLGGADPLTTDGKPLLFKTTQSDVAVVDACILCYFTKFGFTLKEIFQMVNPATGFEYKNPRDLELVGERITTLARLFNVREGFDIKDDRLPKRCLEEPLKKGPAKGHVVELDQMRTEYYSMMGWDERGVPTEEKVKELGLDCIVTGKPVMQ
ncbi:MAG: aldehyde ferredoxin oxidoreductase family protein [Pseudomonadota bacterium]